jgi:Fur family transcriptional regulator, stress-responsive regulator
MPQGDASIRTQLRQAGLRATGPRQAVLEWLAEHPHATADEIGRGVRTRIGSVSTQAIYDVLAACAKAGLLRWIEPAGHPTRYERRTGDHHHHLVCRICGRIEDVDRVVGAQACMTADDDRGYELDEAEVVFWGVCPDCLHAAESGSAPPQSAASHHEEAQE